MKKKLMSILLALSMVMGLSVPVFAAENEPENIYLQPIQVAENKWEYWDDEGNLVATMEGLYELPMELQKSRASTGPWVIDWSLAPGSARYDGREFDGNNTTLYIDISVDNRNPSYRGSYLHDANRFVWYTTPSTVGFPYTSFTVNTNSTFSFALRNDGATTTRYFGRYALKSFM